MTTIASRLQAIHERIDAAARTCDRSSAEIALIAVCKSFPVAAIMEARAAGQVAFGENYLQEAVQKIALTATPEQHMAPVEWHFLGPIQSNKTQQIAQLFDWVHSLDRLKIAQRLSSARPQNRAPLQVCIQVNTSGEQSKGGVRPDEVLGLAKALSSSLDGIRLRGLMTIPEPTPDIATLRARFRLLRQLRDDIVANGIEQDTLSMGMSDDFEAAIAEGATLIRVGRAIFGERPN